MRGEPALAGLGRRALATDTHQLTLALAAAWLLDAFEVKIIGSIIPTITEQ